jgi:hypothetical protein
VVASARSIGTGFTGVQKAMTAKKQKTESKDEKALRLAETTDVSPKQAKELMRKHGKNSPKVEKEARNFKAEG